MPRIHFPITMRHLLPAAGLLLLSGPVLPADGGTGVTGSVVQMLLGLALIIGLLIGSLHLLKRLGAGQAGKAGLVKVRGATAVGPRERVVLVEVADKVLVLGVAPGRVTPLYTLDAIDLPTATGDTPSSASSGADFQAWLKQTLERRPR